MDKINNRLRMSANFRMNNPDTYIPTALVLFFYDFFAHIKCFISFETITIYYYQSQRVAYKIKHAQRIAKFLF